MVEEFAQACESYIRQCRQRKGPNGYDFVAILRACSIARALVFGRLVFGHVLEAGLAFNLHVHNTLVDMYAKCGCLEDALHTFDRMPHRDVVSWNVLIAGYGHLRPDTASELWGRMLSEGFIPDNYTFVCILKVYASIKHLVQGRQIHHFVVLSSLEDDIYVGCALIDMYSSCASIFDAKAVFDCLPEQTLYTWNALMSGCAAHADDNVTFSIFARMLGEELLPHPITFVCVLKVCSRLALVKQGGLAHAFVIEMGLESNVFITSILIDMYSQCGSLEDSLCAFRISEKDDAIVWGPMITAFVHHGHERQALSYFRQMQQNVLYIDALIHACVLKACSNLRAREQAKMIHVYMMENGLGMNTDVSNVLIDVHVKCGCLKDARVVFDLLSKKDVVTWNTLVAGYAEDCNEEALELFHRMLEQGEVPDSVTIISVLKACSRLSNLDEGKFVHDYVKQSSLPIDVLMINALIDMYNKCGSLPEAQKLFNEMPRRDVVTWSAMITGCVQHWRGEDAFLYFQQMLQEEVTPNQGALVGVLSACAIEAAFYAGRLVHAFIVDLYLHDDLALGNALICMYSNSGSCDDAHGVFEKMKTRDEVTWTSMITCFGRGEMYELALRCFSGMLKEGFKPNDVTFTCLLSSCSRIGSMREGCGLFDSLTKHQIAPTAQHFNCIVDLMGRGNQIEKAEELLVSMPFYLNAIGWSCLLNHCKTHGNVELGRRCFDRVIVLDPKDHSAYSLMLSIYADAGMYDEVEYLELKKRSINPTEDTGDSQIKDAGERSQILSLSGCALVSYQSSTNNIF